MKLHNEDCKITMKGMEENSIPFIITDPPYLLNFMGKEFDSQHQKYDGLNEGQKMQKWHEEWCKEAFRVLKPGGYLVAFGGSRTAHRLASAMEDTGFEIRDTISWIYGQGFPKSFDMSKGIDKHFGKERKVIGQIKRGDVQKAKENGRGYLADPANRNNVEDITKPATEEAQTWEGWGTALKPAYEPIIIGMKPVDKSFVNNALEHGVAGININDSRIIYKNEEDFESAKGGNVGSTKCNIFYANGKKQSEKITNKGRWPANVILQHHPECEMIGYKKVKGHKGYPNGPGGMYSEEYRKNNPDKVNNWNDFSTKKDNEKWDGHADKDGKETIEEWKCHDDCPVKIMDEQSGNRKTTWVSPNHQNNRNGEFLGSMKHPGQQGYNDEGGASRFFYTTKASKGERNLGLDGMETKHRRRDDGQPYCMNTNEYRPDGSKRKEIEPQQNYHPTVKSVEIMLYLVKMFSTPEGGTVYDPFMGSGTTGIACKILDREFIGSEMDNEYFPIAKKRLEYNWKSWYFNNKKDDKIIIKDEIINKFFD